MSITALTVTHSLSNNCVTGVCVLELVPCEVCVCVCVCASTWVVSIHVCQKVILVLTVRCWNSHALMMLVATLGKMPRFFCLFLSLSGSSSSPVPGDATLLSKPSPGRKPNPGLNNIPECITDTDHNQRKPGRKAESEVQSKTEFKAHERRINGQIPQMPMKEFKSTAVRLEESLQQSQRRCGGRGI